MEAKPNLKEMTKKERAGYIWDYYKWFIIGGIVAIIAIVSTVRSFVTQKETAVEFVAVNCENFTLKNDEFEEYLNLRAYDTNEYEVSLVNSILISDETYTGGAIDGNAYTSTMQLAAMFAAGEVDIFAGAGTAYKIQASQGALLDLREYLSEEAIASLGEENIFYCVNEEDGLDYPCAINITGCRWLEDHPFYFGECYIGVGIRSDHQAEGIEFVKYLLEYK